MASERLTISEKDRIAKSIIKPLIEQSKIEKLRAELSKL